MRAPLSTMAVPVSYTCCRVSYRFGELLKEDREAYQGIFVERRNRRIRNLLRVSYAQGFKFHVCLAYDSNAVVVYVSLFVEFLLDFGVLYRGSGLRLGACSRQRGWRATHCTPPGWRLVLLTVWESTGETEYVSNHVNKHLSRPTSSSGRRATRRDGRKRKR